MDTTLFLAQVLGVYMTVIGISILMYPKRTSKAIHEMASDYFLPYFGGTMALVFGLLIVLTHNVWENLTTSAISLIGWAALVKGMLLFLLPHDSFAEFAEKFNSRHAMTIWGVIALVIGVYLLYSGFIA